MTVARSARTRGETRRVAVVSLTAVVLVALGVVAGSSSAAPGSGPAPSAALVGLTAESVATFCGGLEHVAGIVASDVAVADLAAAPRTLEVTTTDDVGRHSVREVGVSPGRVVHLDPAALLAGGSVDAMSIVASGGGVAASEAIRGVDGTAVAPCLTQAEPTWWLTGGSTVRGQSFVVSIYNPYASQAIVTASYVTPSLTGYESVRSLDQAVLGPYQEVGLSMHDVAPDESPVSVAVQTTAGAVVVYGVQRSTKGKSDVALLAGTPAPSTDTFVPLLHTGAATRSLLALTNTTITPITATVRLGTALGCGPRCPAPLSESVGPDLTTFLNVGSISRAAKASATLGAEVVGDAPGLVVAQRTLTLSSEGQASILADPTGRGADELVLVDPVGSRFDDLGLVNPSGAPVRVELVTVLAHGTRSVHRPVLVLAHSSLAVAGRALHGVVGGVVLVEAQGPVLASADVHGTVPGAGVLVAVPVG